MNRTPIRPELRELGDLDERLRRQIHPGFKRADSITSQVFSQSDRMISVYRDAVIDFEGARKHWVGQGKPTAGSCVVTAGEVVSAGARTVDDSAYQDVHDSHAYIDVRGLPNSECDKIAKRLKHVAVMRGIEWLSF